MVKYDYWYNSEDVFILNMVEMLELMKIVHFEKFHITWISKKVSVSDNIINSKLMVLVVSKSKTF